MSEWKEIEIGEVADLINGFAFKSKDFLTNKTSDSVLPILKIKNVANGDANFNDVVYHQYTDKLKNYVISKNDILIALTGNHPFAKSQVVGGVSRYNHNENALLNQRVGKIISRDKSKLNNDFLYYFLKWNRTQFFLGNQSSGSASQANISKNDVLSCPVLLPDAEEQKEIAKTLSLLDQKIILLRQQNQDLEELAQTLFKRWFVEFEFPNENGEPYLSSGGKMVESELGEIPEGWKVGVLSEEFTILMGQSPAGSSYNENKEGKVFYQGRTDFGFRFPTNRLYTNEPKRIAEKFDVLVSVRAPVGDVNMASEECCIGRGLAAVKSDLKSYCFNKIKSLKKAFDVFEGEGTVFGSLSKNDFNDLEVIIPQTQIKNKFDKVVFPIDSKILDNTNEIQTLTQLRDTLLPKLMSGELRIKG